MNLSDRMEFDRAIRVHADGSVTDEPTVYAPSLYVDEDGDDVLESVGGEWELMNGYSGQYGYAGPIMHSSEFIGGAMERDILAEPGLYVALVAYSLDDDEDGDGIAGWAVARWLD